MSPQSVAHLYVRSLQRKLKARSTLCIRFRGACLRAHRTPTTIIFIVVPFVNFFVCTGGTAVGGALVRQEFATQTQGAKPEGVFTYVEGDKSTDFRCITQFIPPRFSVRRNCVRQGFGAERRRRCSYLLRAEHRKSNRRITQFLPPKISGGKDACP